MQQKKQHSPSFLVELMLVVLFFCIAGAAILQLFIATNSQSQKATLLTSAQLAAESWSDRLWLTNDAETFLTENGFASNGSVWHKEDDSGLLVEITFTDENTDAGTLRKGSVSVLKDGDLLLTLPCDRYFSGEASK